MTDNAPERIWATYVDYRKDWGNWQAIDVGLHRPAEYIRLDLYNAVCAERDKLKARNRHLSGEYDVVLAGRADEYDRAEAAEAEVERLRGVLKTLADCVDDGCLCSEMRMATAVDAARAALQTGGGND